MESLMGDFLPYQLAPKLSLAVYRQGTLIEDLTQIRELRLKDFFEGF